MTHQRIHRVAREDRFSASATCHAQRRPWGSAVEGSPAFGMRAGRRGFTLVEITVALFVVGFGFTAVLASFPVGAQWARKSAARSVGSRLARAYYNELATQFSGYPAVNATWSPPVAGATGWVDGGSRPRALGNAVDHTGFSAYNAGYFPATPGLPRRNRLYEKSDAILQGGGDMALPPRETGGFYLVAALNITTLFPNHANMSSTQTISQFGGVVTGNTGEALYTESGATAASAPELEQAEFRLYDVYIYVYDSDPTAATTGTALEKKLVTTFRSRAWLGWQPPA